MPQDLTELINRLRTLSVETEYVEFKESFSDPGREGKDISALANSAAYHDARAAYKVWGINDTTHEVTGTSFNPRTKKRGNQSLEVWLRQMLSDNANFDFLPTTYEGRQVVVLRIWPASIHPVRFQGAAFIRTDSSTQLLVPGSSRETELWRKISHESFETLVAREDLSLDDAFGLLPYMSYFDLVGLPRTQDLGLALRPLRRGFGAFLPRSSGRHALWLTTSKGMASTSSAPRSMSSRPQVHLYGTGTSLTSSK